MPQSFERPVWLRGATLATVLALVGWWLHASLVDPRVPYLERHAGAEWIVYPSAPSARIQNGVELEARFARKFELTSAPSDARVVLHARTAFDVELNGVRLGSGDGTDWKRAREFRTQGALRAGVNELVVRVRHALGPPALWCTLELDDGSRSVSDSTRSVSDSTRSVSDSTRSASDSTRSASDSMWIATDSTWSASLAGASERPARLAATPLDEWATATSASPSTMLGSAPGATRRSDVPAPFAALRANFGFALALFGAGLAAAFALGRVREEATKLRLERWLVRGSIAAWILLFFVNSGIDPSFGFDVEGHIEYVDYVLQRGALPLAHEGWEAYQPPLYYVVAAGLLDLCGYTAADASSVWLLRWLGCAAGIVQILAVALGARATFGAGTRATAIAITFAAFVPMQLYLAHFPTNEVWAAALSSVALAWTAKRLSSDARRTRELVWIGVTLGAALLTKFSALIPLVVCVGALGLDAWSRGARRAKELALPLALVLGCVVVVAGWHYARVTAHFGTPIVGNWDAESGRAWWQQPGYRTSGDFLRFGRVFGEPVLAGLHSVPDALYSTLFGDGMIAGSADPHVRPPWRWELVSLLFAVGLAPLALLVLGFAATCVRWWRAPTPRDFLLLASAVATGFALLALALRLPFYAQAKAFYGGAVLLPLAVFVATGCELVARRGRWFAILVGGGAIGCAVTAYLAHFSGGAPRAPAPAVAAVGTPAEWVELATTKTAEGDRAGAEAALGRALALDFDRADSWNVAAEVAAHFGESDEAVRRAREALRCAPENAWLHGLAADLLARTGAEREARSHVAIALAIEPENPRALEVLARLGPTAER
ncbi:MAG: hypothetical protein L6Q99_15570 [Planctomycetes bacterium]|nr:hypothetical protein [Planctomycetota bacterium]